MKVRGHLLREVAPNLCTVQRVRSSMYTRTNTAIAIVTTPIAYVTCKFVSYKIGMWWYNRH